MSAQPEHIVWHEFSIAAFNEILWSTGFYGCGYNVCHISHGELTHVVNRLRVAMTYAHIEMMVWLTPLGSSEEQDTQMQIDNALSLFAILPVCSRTINQSIFDDDSDAVPEFPFGIFTTTASTFRSQRIVVFRPECPRAAPKSPKRFYHVHCDDDKNSGKKLHSFFAFNDSRPYHSVIFTHDSITIIWQMLLRVSTMHSSEGVEITGATQTCSSRAPQLQHFCSVVWTCCSIKKSLFGDPIFNDNIIWRLDSTVLYFV